MKLRDKVVEALKEDAESDSGFLSGFSKLDLCFKIASSPSTEKPR